MHHLIETNRFYNQGVRSHQARKIISIPLLCCGSKRLMSCKSSQRPFIFSESRWRRTVIAVAANSVMPALTSTTLGWSSLCTNQQWHAEAATNCNIYAASWLLGAGGYICTRWVSFCYIFHQQLIRLGSPFTSNYIDTKSQLFWIITETQDEILNCAQ